MNRIFLAVLVLLAITSCDNTKHTYHVSSFSFLDGDSNVGIEFVDSMVTTSIQPDEKEFLDKIRRSMAESHKSNPNWRAVGIISINRID